MPLADRFRNSVQQLDGLDAAFQNGEQGGPVALVRCELARDQADVGRRPRDPLAGLAVQRREEPHALYLLRRDHRPPTLNPPGRKRRSTSSVPEGASER